MLTCYFKFASMQNVNFFEKEIFRWFATQDIFLFLGCSIQLMTYSSMRLLSHVGFHFQGPVIPSGRIRNKDYTSQGISLDFREIKYHSAKPILSGCARFSS